MNDNLVLQHFSNHVAILQLENLNDTHRIETYINSLPQGTIVVLGEYVLNPFFSEQWIIQPDSSLQHNEKLCYLNDLANKHKHTFIAPIAQQKDSGFYKDIAILANNEVVFYSQQRLIQFNHWNESSFFSNDTTKLPKLPFTFKANDVHFGVLFGFEAHFDEFWTEFKKASVDVVLVPTASTFSSQMRWQSLLTTHAFTNSCYVFRANRIGKHISNDGYEWDFYGHSFVSLGQEILDYIEDDEGMLDIELDMQALQTLKKEWNFR